MSFGPDVTVNTMRQKVSEVADGKQNFESLQAMVQTHQLKLNQLTSFDFFFLSNEFVDLVNYYQFSKNGGQVLRLVQERETFKKQFINNVCRLPTRCFDVSLKVKSSKYMVSAIHGPGSYQNDQMSCNSMQDDQIFSVQLSAPPQRLKYFEYVQFQLIYKQMSGQTVLRVATVELVPTFDLNE